MKACHVMYSKRCKRVIEKAIYEHYSSEERNNIFALVDKQYMDWLETYRTDLHGKKNFHNGTGGTYDCIMIFAYYVVCKEVTCFKEIEKLYEDLFMPSFKWLSFVDINKKFFKKLLYKSFVLAQKQCEKWKDYEMIIEPYKEDEPIRYRFISCPVAQFAHEHDLLDILPALCNVDYVAMETLHAKLIRTTTLCRGDCCDYTICADSDSYIDNYPEYNDEVNGRWNTYVEKS